MWYDKLFQYLQPLVAMHDNSILGIPCEKSSTISYPFAQFMNLYNLKQNRFSLPHLSLIEYMTLRNPPSGKTEPEY
jgi:hypothetical protein